MTETVQIGKVSSLHCYPIKSCGGISGEEAFCNRFGVLLGDAQDRHFMIVRQNGDFITQRQNAKMAAIKTSVDGDSLVLQSHLMKSSIKVPLHPTADIGLSKRVRVWQSHLDGLDCGDAVSSWLSECLTESELRLVVSIPEMKKREISHANAPPNIEVAYPDDAPILVVNSASLKDLKSSIPDSDAITATNFRPNIVIETSTPWDEDQWTSLKIGEADLNVLYPCGRCVFTTVDPDLCERRKDGEPLNTLKARRLFPDIKKSNPLFGVYVCSKTDGVIRVGDSVTVTRKT